MSDFVAPSSLESRFYYHGLRVSMTGVKSGPYLVYRTSKDVFPGAGRPEDREMQLLPVGRHHRLSKNNLWDTVRMQTVKILDQFKIKLSSVDLVQFGWRNKYGVSVTSSPTIWIGVLPQTTSAKVAGASADKILALLRGYRIDDIDIAFRESVAYPSVANGPRLYPSFAANHPLRNVADWVTTSLSMPIAGLNSLDREGTFGFYFKVGKDLYGVTARHVLFPPDRYGNAYYKYIENRMPLLFLPLPDLGSSDGHNDDLAASPHPDSDKKWVVLMGYKSFEEFLKCAKNALVDMDKCINNMKQVIQTETRRIPQNLEKLAESHSALNDFRHKKHTLQSFHEEVKDENKWSTIQNRIIGHIVWAPPIVTKHYTQDVCVFKLINEKFLPSMEGHVIETATGNGPLKFLQHASMCLAPKPNRDQILRDFGWPHTRPYPLTNILRIQDIRFRATEDDSSNLVFKCGRTTGTTLGRIGKMLSYRREYSPTHIFESQELPITSYNGKWGAFSDGGDSGAAIIGGNNDFVAMLTSGIGLTNSTDITYCTPFEWLWEEVIKKEFPTAQLFF